MAFSDLEEVEISIFRRFGLDESFSSGVVLDVVPSFDVAVDFEVCFVVLASLASS